MFHVKHRVAIFVALVTVTFAYLVSGPASQPGRIASQARAETPAQTPSTGLSAVSAPLLSDGAETSSRPVQRHRATTDPVGIQAAAVGELVTRLWVESVIAEGDRLAALEAERERVAAEAAELARQQEALARRYPSSASGAGGACGGATNGADAFIHRETNGSPDPANQWNTEGSGAWGCYQIMPGTWASSCSDLGVHGQASASVQAQCASRLPSSAWASSGPT